MTSELDLSIVIPCLNERETIGAVVEKATRSIAALKLTGEVIVSDNGSTDGSVELAAVGGARVVHARMRGYGCALREGMQQARGRLIVMGDADDTYNFEEIASLVERLEAGADLVMGTRLPPGQIIAGANPWLNRHLGTPVLTFVLNRLFGTSIHDANCGLRGLRRSAFEAMSLRSQGMEFASEMVIVAALRRMRIEEVPVTLYPDRRTNRSHLRRWRDCWRHLEFMLLHAPDQLLFFPGIAAITLGLLLAVPVSFGQRTLFGHPFDFHYLFYGGALVFAGLQGVMSAILVRDIVGGLIIRPNRLASALAHWFTFGRGLAVGGALVVVGMVLEAVVIAIWIRGAFGPLLEPRRSVIGMLCIGVGAEIAVFSFLHAILRKHVGARIPHQ